MSTHIKAPAETVQTALTMAESLAYDNGRRDCALALARVHIDGASEHTTATFTVGCADTRADAVDELRTHLGLAACYLQERNWLSYADTLRALSANAK